MGVLTKKKQLTKLALLISAPMLPGFQTRITEVTGRLYHKRVRV